MLFFVIGPSGSFPEWCRAVTLKLAEGVLGRCEVIVANTLEEIACAMLRSDTSHAVVTAYQPGGRVRQALVEAACPCIVALDDPLVVLAYLATRHGVGVARATQLVAGSCASSFRFVATPRALILRADRDGRDLLPTATAIARHLRLDISESEITRIVHHLGDANPPFEIGNATAWWNGLDQAEQMIARGALSAYADLDAKRGLGPLTWAPALFRLADQPNEPVTGGIDITGRARCLLRGPHIMLPPEDWLLTLSFHFSPDAAEHSFLLEAAAGAVLSRTVIRPVAAGLVEANLSLALSELPDQPIELRLYNERPAFGGHVTLLHVTAAPRHAAAETASIPGDLQPSGSDGA